MGASEKRLFEPPYPQKASKDWFISSVTTLSTEFKTSSTLFGWDVEKKFLKYPSTIPAIRSSSIHHTPSSSLKPSIWFLRCLWLARLWKNLVFISPTRSHIVRDLCLQKKFSWCSRSLIFPLNLLICCMLFPYPVLISSSKAACFSSSLCFVLPKTSWLHARCNQPPPTLFYFLEQFEHQAIIGRI